MGYDGANVNMGTTGGLKRNDALDSSVLVPIPQTSSERCSKAHKVDEIL